MSEPFELPIGSIFADRYEVEKKLSQGGMGAVYIVRHTRTDERLALKVMLPEVADQPESKRRFEREAKVGARIGSEHVVKVVDAEINSSTATPYLVMELLTGETLEDRVARAGRLDAATTLAAFEELCAALAAAHRHSDVIVHRDLKPENIFLAVTRRRGAPFLVKVLDFGIARIVAEARTTSSRTNKPIGTPLYMAPEQLNPNAPVSPATDVWALGLIAFYLLAGKSYWRAPNANGTIEMLLAEILALPLPSASTRAAELGGWGLPTGFDAWFARAVARDPAQRFRDAGEAFDWLEPTLSASASAPVTAPIWTKTVPDAPARPVPTVPDNGSRQQATHHPASDADQAVYRGQRAAAESDQRSADLASLHIDRNASSPSRRMTTDMRADDLAALHIDRDTPLPVLPTEPTSRAFTIVVTLVGAFLALVIAYYMLK